MNRSSYAILFPIALIVYLTSASACLAITWNCTVAPSPGDTFKEASFRFYSTSTGSHAVRFLTFIPGTDADGRNIGQDKRFVEAAVNCEAILVGCYFRGGPMSYCNSQRGSGKALTEAIDQYIHHFGLRAVSDRPIILLGYSEGAQFVASFISSQSDRVAAFAAIKGGSYVTDFPRESYSVPGLFVVGSNDLSSRVRSGADLFLKASERSRVWAFLLEKGGQHEMSNVGFILSFISAAVQRSNRFDSFFGILRSGRIVHEREPGTLSSWLPDMATAIAWKDLQEPVSKAELLSISKALDLNESPEVVFEPQNYECSQSTRQTGSFIILANSRCSPLSAHVSSGAFRILSTNIDSRALTGKIEFTPIAMPWGPCSEDLIINMLVNKSYIQTFEVSVHGYVRGPVHASPSMFLLAPALSGAITSQEIRLVSDAKYIHVRSIVSPPCLKVHVFDCPTNHCLKAVATCKIDKLPPQYSGYIKVIFDRPQAGILKIPFAGTVLDSKSNHSRPSSP